MILTAHQPQYLPGPRLLHKIASSDKFVLLDHLPHSHNSFENRNKIRTANGEQWLTVPVVHGSSTLAETKIAPGNWPRKHYRALEMNYSRTSQWKSYERWLKKLYASPGSDLMDLAEDTRDGLCMEFHVICEPIHASDLKPEGENWRMILSLCQKLNADTFLFGSQGRAYMTQEAKEAFRKAGVKPVFQAYNDALEYKQAYQGFIPNLSALDILLNLGPDGREFIMKAGRLEE